MNLRRAVLSGIGGAALVVWIASAATTGVRPSPEAPATNRAVEVSGARLAHEIARLHERLRPTAVPIQTRDLFSYTPRSVAAVDAGGEPAAVVTAVEGPKASPLKLVGLAEDGPADAVVRTAVLSGLGELFLVKEGEMVGARYRVSKVSSDAVELVDSVDQSSFRLALP